MPQDPLFEPEAEPAPSAEVGPAGAPVGVAAEGELGALLAPAAPASQPATPPLPRASETPPLPSAARAPAPTAHAAYLARRHFGALDGLRALAILAVVWHHTVGGPGRFGANLFFLLSGFLVTTLLVRERARKGRIEVTRFRTRRARRLYPLYFAVLLGYVALVAVLEPAGPTRAAFFEHLPAFATFTSNWLVDLEGERTIFYFAWSLAAQEQFYLVWPLYLKHVGRRACAAALASALLTVYLTRAGAFDLALPSGSFTRTLVLSLMPALLLGALGALLLDAERGYAAVRRVLGGRWTALGLLGAVLLAWRTPSVPEGALHALLAALTLACVVREDHALARLLRWRPLVHVGAVSYGIYLLHMLCHNAAERGLARLGLGQPVLDFALTAALAVGLATLSQRWFETRFLPADKRPRAA
jgi:peptidoglycan/LPS O-acetylase OafA/YrhL